MWLFDFRFVFYHLSCELTVAQHVKCLREQSEALSGARVAAAARVMLQSEPPVADTQKQNVLKMTINHIVLCF